MKSYILFFFCLSLSINGFAQHIDLKENPALRFKPSVADSTLIVIDGQKQYIRGSSALNNLRANDIQSINILKDSIAFHKYGTEGIAGVIEVQTKSGKVNLPPAKTISGSPELGTVIIESGPYKKMPDTARVIIRNLLLKDTDPKAKIRYVVNGKEVTDISFLKPDQIKSIDVIKDASSTLSKEDQQKETMISITTKPR